MQQRFALERRTDECNGSGERKAQMVCAELHTGLELFWQSMQFTDWTLPYPVNTTAAREAAAINAANGNQYVPPIDGTK